ncbi:MAG: BhlA/UviB family holin-like peptide [Tissierellales bacterium]|nr:BhlA/UviB family holin-like peptide [Tissierellales bacterium]
MESKILELAATQGVWSALSVGLIYYILKNQEKRDLRQEERESKYQDIITTLSEKFNVVEDVKKDVEEIKVILEK